MYIRWVGFSLIQQSFIQVIIEKNSGIWGNKKKDSEKDQHPLRCFSINQSIKQLKKCLIFSIFLKRLAFIHSRLLKCNQITAESEVTRP
jgi:hypothetical protein